MSSTKIKWFILPYYIYLIAFNFEIKKNLKTNLFVNNFRRKLYLIILNYYYYYYYYCYYSSTKGSELKFSKEKQSVIHVLALRDSLHGINQEKKIIAK